MPVNIQQSKKFTDSVHIASSDPNTPDLDFTYELAPEMMVGRAQKLIAALENAQNELLLHSDSEQAAEAYGTAVLNLFVLFFGTENAEKIVDFYEGRYADMLSDFLPAITKDIMPKLRDASRKKAGWFKRAAKRRKV